MNQNITAMTQTTFNSIINTALLKANDRDNLKSYIIRQSKIAERDAFYTWDDFSAGLIKDVTEKMQGLEFEFNLWKKFLSNEINNVDYKTFSIPSSPNSLTWPEIRENQKIQKEKYLKKCSQELESGTINNFKNHRNEYRRLEIIIDVVNEINNKNSNVVSDEPQRKPTAKQHALAYILDCDANGRNRLEGQKKRLEEIGKKRSGKSGNTFYKACNELQRIDINSGRTISAWLGDDWANIKSIILDLSEDRKTLIEYFEKKQL